MGHSHGRFFLDRRPIVWYVVNDPYPPLSYYYNELGTGIKYAALFTPIPLSLVDEYGNVVAYASSPYVPTFCTRRD